MSQRFNDVSFRQITADDLPTLHSWFQRPHVAEWWSSSRTLADVVDHYSPLIEGLTSTKAYMADLNRETIGFIQAYVVAGAGDGWWESEKDPGARGIDQFLADPSRLNQGIGASMIRRFVATLYEDPAVSKIQADPHPANHRAIRCYMKVGFVPVGEVVTPGGPALLMRCERPIVG